MKAVFTFGLALFSLVSFAQKKYTAKDFFLEKSIVWYGVDYSKAKFIGSFSQFKDAGEVNGNALVQRYFPAWNTTILREPAKYDTMSFP